MTDQVAFLNHEPAHFQVGEPGAPCGGSSTCTDCVVAAIVRHETGRPLSAAAVRHAAAPGKDPCRGLTPAEALRALAHFGVRGYVGVAGVTASEAIRATDRGVVLVAVGYNGFPSQAQAEVGGRTDFGFAGPHAISLWGRRYWAERPAGWPAGKHFEAGWRVWTRDPDHHYGAARPPYDRFRSSFLVAAMDALVGNGGWSTRFAILRRAPAAAHPAAAAHLTGLEPHAVHVAAAAELGDLELEGLPEFGVGQAG